MTEKWSASQRAFIPLTALWAFVESGLGGMMHAFQLPFTGFVLGAFSILVISLLAAFSRPVFGQILKATLIVMAVKAAVNPMTSPMAYIAVGFQGLCGALLFSIRRRNMVLSVVFGAVTMLESAVQKLLVLTLVFGKSWLHAMDAYFESVVTMFGLSPEAKGSQLVVGSYLTLYVVWGVVLGVWVYFLPRQLAARRDHYAHIVAENAAPSPAQSARKRRGGMWFGLGLGLLFVMSYYFLSGQSTSSKALTVLLRTACVVALWVWVVLPLWSRLMKNWLQKQTNKRQDIAEVLGFMPEIAAYVRPLYRDASGKFSGLKKWKEFILSLMVVTLRLRHVE